MLRRLSVPFLLLVCGGIAFATFSREVVYTDGQSGFSFFGAGSRDNSSVLRIDSVVEGIVSGGDADVTFTVRIRNAKKHPKGGYSIYLAGNRADTMRVSVTPCEASDPLRDEERTLLRLTIGDEVIASAYLPRSRFDDRDGFNTLGIGRKGNMLEVSAGRMESACVIQTADAEGRFRGEVTSAGIEAGRDNAVEVECARVVSYPSARRRLSTGLSVSEIASSVHNGEGEPCGFWTLLDFDVDDRYMRCGGDYRLAIVRWGDLADKAAEFTSRYGYPSEAFAILYLEGAGVDRHRWEAGMLKGVMLPTPLKSAWRLVWFDSKGETIDPERYASMSTATIDESGRILQLAFPERYSSLRFIRSSVGMQAVQKKINTEICE